MTDMVERVARAVSLSFFGYDCLPNDIDLAYTDGTQSSVVMMAAKSAIAAMQADAAPVAWMYVNDDGECEQIDYGPDQPLEGFTPLYSHPIDLPAEREAAARAALETAAKAIRATHIGGEGLAIRAIDPAQFREGSNG